MFFILSKILHFIISPLVVAFVLLLFSLLMKRKNYKKKVLFLSFVVLYFFSNAFVLEEAFRFYEEKGMPIESLEKHDIAIVLGGFSGYNEQEDRIQFNASSDRLLHALQLYRMGKVKKLMIVGGSGSIAHPNEKEGVLVSQFLLRLGVPKKDIIVESKSKNTRENAVYTAEIINEQYAKMSCILLTSAYHMPRAKQCFDKVGLDVTPFSVDHYARKRSYQIDHLFIPDAGALARWNFLLHEWAGFLSYKIAGYI